MDQQGNEAAMSDEAAKVGETVDNLTAEAGKLVQDRIDQTSLYYGSCGKALPRWIRPPTWPTRRRTLRFRR